MAAGIDDVAIYIPRLYLDAADFANARGLDPVKLQKGLGVSQMAIVDANQDPACLAANACLRIMEKNNLSPEDIGQGIVIENGLVLGIETLQGTNELLKFVAKTASHLRLDSRGGIFVKRPKVNQNLRFDMPVIGPETIQLAFEAGLRGLVISPHSVSFSKISTSALLFLKLTFDFNNLPVDLTLISIVFSNSFFEAKIFRSLN